MPARRATSGVSISIPFSVHRSTEWQNASVLPEMAGKKRSRPLKCDIFLSTDPVGFTDAVYRLS
jgi:hypothetical protein